MTIITEEQAKEPWPWQSSWKSFNIKRCHAVHDIQRTLSLSLLSLTDAHTHLHTHIRAHTHGRTHTHTHIKRRTTNLLDVLTVSGFRQVNIVRHAVSVQVISLFESLDEVWAKVRGGRRFDFVVLASVAAIPSNASFSATCSLQFSVFFLWANSLQKWLAYRLQWL